MEFTFSLSLAQQLQFILAVFLPVLVGLVTTRVTSAARKAILLLALSVITSLLTEILNAVMSGQSYDLGTGLMAALTTFIIGVSMHYGLWKPTGVSEAAKEVGGPPRP